MITGGLVGGWPVRGPLPSPVQPGGSARLLGRVSSGLKVGSCGVEKEPPDADAHTGIAFQVMRQAKRNGAQPTSGAADAWFLHHYQIFHRPWHLCR